jgi:long-chain acyl-CoA synthetase
VGARDGDHRRRGLLPQLRRHPAGSAGDHRRRDREAGSTPDPLASHAATRGDKTALIQGDRVITFAELHQRANRVAAALRRLGVEAGDRVTGISYNSIEGSEIAHGSRRVAVVGVPINYHLKPVELAYIVNDSGARVLTSSPDFLEVVEEARPHLQGAPKLVLTGPGQAPPGWLSYEELLAEATSEEASDGSSPLGASMIYTSGTTGRPKGAMLTHFNAVHSCIHWQEVHGLGEQERTALCVPWSHVAGLCGVVLPFLAIGGTLVTLADFKRREFLQLAQQERITHALMVPAMYGLCLLEPDLGSFELGSWRLGVYGSAPMPEPTIRRFAEMFPRLQMCNAYGATETTSPATIMPPGDGVAHAESIGKVVPCGDIRVMDDQGRELAPGEEGELWIGGPMVVPGYWRNQEANASSFAGGYWKSGDIGAIDAEGYVRIADRKKDMINRGGFKVYPAEVENVLTAIEGVIEAAVVGRPDEVLGEGVVAFLNVKQDLQAEAVRAFCSERMADYKVPGLVVVGREPLPRNANGKIQKAQLRQMALALPPAGRTR